MELLYDVSLFPCESTTPKSVIVSDRLENQHLRNVRQLRITHKIPPSCCSDEHSDEEVDEKARGAVSWLKQQVTRVKRNGSSERSAV